jgi:hypothetical protein
MSDNELTKDSMTPLADERGENLQGKEAMKGMLPEVWAEWDADLKALWHPSLEVALRAAASLYAPADTSEEALPEEQDWLSSHFWRLLIEAYKRPPESAVERYQAIVAAIRRIVRVARETPTEPFVEDVMEVALRPIRRLQIGALTLEVCAALWDYHRGIWTVHLTKPQMWKLRNSLARTIAALPPDRMGAFWTNLQSDNPMVRDAMRLGLEFLRSAHAVPHLLQGLEQIQDHATRAAIVDRLEQIADPRAIAALTRLRRETAQTDWTLSRQIARALRVIEQQNRGQSHRLLLRPSTTPPEGDRTLMRPAVDTPAMQDRHAAESADLLRSAESAEEKERKRAS